MRRAAGSSFEELSDQALEDIFVHEAAHLARRDAWVAVLQQLAAGLFWVEHFLDPH